MVTKPSAQTRSSKSLIAFLEEAPKPPAPPQPPKFPTLEELLGVELQAQPQKHTGLLYELLGGSPMPIYNDVQTNPEKYQPEDVEFVARIVARGPQAKSNLSCGCPSEHWDLSEGEKHRLDQMTLTFATAKRIEPPPTRQQPMAKKKAKETPTSPITKMPLFWWLKF